MEYIEIMKETDRCTYMALKKGRGDTVGIEEGMETERQTCNEMD